MGEVSQWFHGRFFGNYILDGHTPVPCEDMVKASMWLFGPGGEERRRVRETKIHDDDVRVSTVFLGIDHNHSFHGPPVLFETMVFGGKYDREQRRYCTWDEAVAGHEEMLRMVTGAEA